MTADALGDMGPLDRLAALAFVVLVVAYAAHRGWRRG